MIYKNKIIDCFIFFNEIDLLEIRLEYMYDKIDHFVIIESNTTFTGLSKSYNFELNENKFSKYKDKIIYVKCDFSELKNKKNNEWEKEEFQRNYILQGLKKLPLKDNDIILISDIDEIPNIDCFKRINFDFKISRINLFYKYVIYSLNSKRKPSKYKHYKLLYKLLIHNLIQPPINFQMKLHYYYINYQSKHNWNGLQAVEYRFFKYFSADQIRSFRKIPIITMKESGWHFSYLGGVNKIIEKINSFSHQEFNTIEINSSKYIEFCIRNGYSLFDPNNKKSMFDLIKIESFPPDLLKVIRRKQFLIYKNDKE